MFVSSCMYFYFVCSFLCATLSMCVCVSPHLSLPWAFPSIPCGMDLHVSPASMHLLLLSSLMSLVSSGSTYF